MGQSDMSKAKKQKPLEEKVKPPTYQPSASELHEEYDMPGASMETLRKAFFKPLEAKDKDAPSAH